MILLLFFFVCFFVWDPTFLNFDKLLSPYVVAAFAASFFCRWIRSQGAEEKGEAGKEAEKSKEEQFQSLCCRDYQEKIGLRMFQMSFVIFVFSVWPVNQLDDPFLKKKHGFDLGGWNIEPPLQDPTPRAGSGSSSDSSSSESSGAMELQIFGPGDYSVCNSPCFVYLCEEKRRKRKPRR